MFTPSKSLLFTNLKIHHPLPLNSRESKQLLNLLTTSFREHLDAEHPAFRCSKTASSSPIKRGTSAHHGTPPRRRSLSESAKVPVDRHMQSILSNPLFSFENKGDMTTDLSEPTARAMKVFDWILSKGMMTCDHAKTLLRTNKRNITASPALDVQKEMRASEAGSKVLKWLVSSGATNDLGFLRDQAFSALLIEHLVAENLQEVVWNWIKILFDRVPALLKLEGDAFTKARHEIANPLLQLVMAEADHSESLGKAYMCLSRAAGYLQGHTAITMRQILYPPGRYLVNNTVYTHSARKAVSDVDFESFLSLLPVMFYATRLSRYTAHLHLFHPTRPQVEPAMRFLKSMHLLRSNQTQTREIVQLGLDTAKHLLEKDRVPEALKIMDILRAEFPGELGVPQRKQLEEVRSEASIMELLEGLSLHGATT